MVLFRIADYLGCFSPTGKITANYYLSPDVSQILLFNSGMATLVSPISTLIRVYVIEQQLKPIFYRRVYVLCNSGMHMQNSVCVPALIDNYSCMFSVWHAYVRKARISLLRLEKRSSIIRFLRIGLVEFGICFLNSQLR